MHNYNYMYMYIYIYIYIYIYPLRQVWLAMSIVAIARSSGPRSQVDTPSGKASISFCHPISDFTC